MADNTGDAVFVAFDLDMAKLTNIPAAEVAEVIVGCLLTHLELQYNLSTTFSSENIFCVCLQGVGVNARVEAEVPQFITDIVGKTFTFQIKLGEFNFTFKHQTFTISRIFSVAQRAPLPDFVGDVNFIDFQTDLLSIYNMTKLFAGF